MNDTRITAMRAPTDKDMIDFAKRLKAARKAAGWSETRLAKALGVSRSHISDVESLRTKPLAEVILSAHQVGMTTRDALWPKL